MLIKIFTVPDQAADQDSQLVIKTEPVTEPETNSCPTAETARIKVEPPTPEPIAEMPAPISESTKFMFMYLIY